MTLRRRWYAALALAAMWPHAAVAGGLDGLASRLLGKKQGGNAYIVLADQSASVSEQDRALYVAAFGATVGGEHCTRLQPGSRVLLAAISDRTAAEIGFTEHAFPRSGVKLDDQAVAVSVCRALHQSFARLLVPPQNAAKRSCILDALFAAGQAMRAVEGAQVRIIVLSDMIEESSIADFSKRPPADARYAAQLSKELEGRGTLPAIRGASLYVIGAGGRSTEEYVRLQQTWAALIGAAGASLGAYGRVVPDFR